MTFEEDILYSLQTDLLGAVVTVKDVTGMAELASGPLSSVFPGIDVYPVRTKDIEDIRCPSIGIAWEPNNAVALSLYGDPDLYRHTVRFMVVGTSLDSNGQPNDDNTVFQAMQLRNALSNLYLKDRWVPWYRVSYDDDGTATLYGQIKLAGQPTVYDIDSAHFVVSVGADVID